MYKLESIYNSYALCRKGKRDKSVKFEIDLLDNIYKIKNSLNKREWSPSAYTCFLSKKPKLREIYAASFADRVVHHLLVSRLEKEFDKTFIYHSYSNRKGKGTHKAVKNLQSFMRKSSKNMKVKSYFLQLDIKNFFYSIDKKNLFELIKEKMAEDNQKYLFLIVKVLFSDINYGVRFIGKKEEFEKIPNHKRLKYLDKNKGLPIGNLTSQFFANVYLNELDKFVKHTLKEKYYMRYVDDFIIVGKEKERLAYVKLEIEKFLWERLGLRLKNEGIIKKVSEGADFLGYMVRANYILVRKRVLGNLLEKLNIYEKQFLIRGDENEVSLNLNPEILESLRSVLASYMGHFSHAKHYNLMNKIKKRYRWLELLFAFRERKNFKSTASPLYQNENCGKFLGQWYYFKTLFPNNVLLIQKGNRIEMYNEDAARMGVSWEIKISKTRGIRECISIKAKNFGNVISYLRSNGCSYSYVSEQGYLKNNLKNRKLRYVYLSKGL